MKPLEFWSMEAVFILTFIGILIGGTALGLLFTWLLARGEKKRRDRK